jgi:ABC-type nitrate/sulfonate/bicarbonate transport system substrate-binding protein
MAKGGQLASRISGGALVALILVGLFYHSGSGGEETAAVRLAIPSYGAAFWPNYIAEKKGFYAQQHLVVKQLQLDPNITVTSLIGGAADIAYADSTQLVYAIQKNANLVAVGLSTDRQPYSLMGGPSITSVAQLKGKKIGAVSAIDVYTYVAKTMLRNAGLDPDKDVQWVIGGNQTRRMAAMTEGLIDAGLFSPPSDSRLAGQGFHRLAFAPDVFEHLTLSTQTVRRDWAEKHGDVLRRMLLAQTNALHWLYDPANEAEATRILMGVTGAKQADAKQAYAYFVKPHAWLDGCVHREGLTTVVTILRAMNQLPTVTEADVPKFVDSQWCPK